MFIKIEDIGPNGLTLDEPLTAQAIGGWLGDDAIYRAAASGRATAAAELVGNDILVRGTVGAVLSYGCSRCLKDTERAFTVPFTALYSERPAGPAEHEGSDEEETGEHQYFAGPIIELDDVVRDNLLLSLPMAPLCADHCRGLCPSCGQDLNVARCGCACQPGPLAAALMKKIETIGAKSPGTAADQRRIRPAGVSRGAGGGAGRAVPRKKGAERGSPETKKIPRPSR